MWTRRRVLLAAVVGLGGTLGGRLALADARAAIILVIRKQLSYLTIDEAGLQQFATDLAATGTYSHQKLKAVQAFAPLYGRVHFTGADSFSSAMRHGEERIISAFLLATDFFHNVPTKPQLCATCACTSRTRTSTPARRRSRCRWPRPEGHLAGDACLSQRSTTQLTPRLSDGVYPPIWK